MVKMVNIASISAHYKQLCYSCCVGRWGWEAKWREQPTGSFVAPVREQDWAGGGEKGMDSQLTSEVDCDGLVRTPGGGGEGDGGECQEGRGRRQWSSPPLLVFLTQATRD